MQKFINPEELKTLLNTENGPLLLVLVDKQNDFVKQKKVLKELFHRFEEELQILLLDIEYQNVVTEKFQVHGSPSFIFCEQGKRKDVLLGTSDLDMLQEFVVNNLSDVQMVRKVFSGRNV